MKKCYLIPAILIAMCGCSNNSDLLDNTGPDIQEKTINISEINSEVTIKNGLLVFEDQATFDAMIQSINEYEAVNIGTRSQKDEGPMLIETRTLSLDKYGFQSLLDVYTEAMNVAEKYYDTEQGYKQFKEKYSGLFFAEQPEDYSAYLPVTNKFIAKLLNKKGEVMIGNEVKDLRDIVTYKQLKDLGFTPESDLDLVTRATVNKLDEIRCNDRKLSARAYSRPGPAGSGVGYEAVVDVTFRKKGFLGAWYNYSSTTTLGWAHNAAQWTKSGYSSHDYVWAIHMVNVGAFRGQMWLKFQGFGGECGATKYYFNVDI